MRCEYPDDADGDALRLLRAGGSDMSKAMEIDFAVAVPDQVAGEAIATKARAAGYTTNVVFDAGDDEVGDPPSWTCYCMRKMIPTYEAVTAAQSDLAELSRPFGGFPDGWGSFGNQGSG